MSLTISLMNCENTILQEIADSRMKRLDICRDAGVDSIDGSSASRFTRNLRKLDAALRQQSLIARAA